MTTRENLTERGSNMTTNSDVPTNTWTVTNRAGREITRVDGETIQDATAAAKQNPDVVESSKREGGYSLRRLRVSEL